MIVKKVLVSQAPFSLKAWFSFVVPQNIHLDIYNQLPTGFYCGTSNVVLPVPNKTFFPLEFQDKSRLAYYSTLFNSVEVNSTFYKLPMAKTIEKWTLDVPTGFRFTFKLWRGITHEKELIYNVNDVHRFMDIIESAGEHKGCLLVQFPASIRLSYFQKVRVLLDDLSETGKLSGWNLAIEFRDPSWYRDAVYELLEKYKASIVIHDMPRSATPSIEMEQTFVYLRFHGEKGDYRGGYESEFLREKSDFIKERLAEGFPAFAYFNNTMGDAVNNAVMLDTYLRSQAL